MYASVCLFFFVLTLCFYFLCAFVCDPNPSPEEHSSETWLRPLCVTIRFVLVAGLRDMFFTRCANVCQLKRHSVTSPVKEKTDRATTPMMESGGLTGWT